MVDLCRCTNSENSCSWFMIVCFFRSLILHFRRFELVFYYISR